jgi:hypothetical protein
MHFNHDPACAARLELARSDAELGSGTPNTKPSTIIASRRALVCILRSQWRGAFMNDILNDLNSVVRKDASREALTARACLPQTNT